MNFWLEKSATAEVRQPRASNALEALPEEQQQTNEVTSRCCNVKTTPPPAARVGIGTAIDGQGTALGFAESLSTKNG